MLRYFVGFFVTIGLIILLIVMLFGGGGSKTKVGKTAKPLVSYASTSAEVSMTIDGPINADQTHKQVRITVDKDHARLDQINGYDGTVAQTKEFASNQNAYKSFLAALAHAGYTLGDTSNKLLNDERGYCPLDNRYIFDLTQSGDTIQRYWASNCGKPKTYLGNFALTIQLFEAQIPNYNDEVNTYSQLQ